MSLALTQTKIIAPIRSILLMHIAKYCIINAMKNQRLCQCKPDCQAVVKSADKQYARGHNPSKGDYSGRGKKISESMKLYYSTHESHFTGKKHTPETIKKLVAACKKRTPEFYAYSESKRQESLTDEQRANWAEAARKAQKVLTEKRRGVPRLMSVRRKISKTRRRQVRLGLITPWNKGTLGAQEAWNKGLTKETDDRIASQAEALEGHKHSTATRNKMSVKAAKRLRREAHSADGSRIRCFQYGNAWMCSTWEVAFAKFCDENGTAWKYESKSFKLTLKGGRVITYTPDFYLPTTDEFIEIKGYENRTKKFDLFKKQHTDVKISLLGKEGLEKLGVSFKWSVVSAVKK